LNALVKAYLRQVAIARQIELFALEPMTLKLEKLIGDVEAELKGSKISQKLDNARVLFANFRNIIQKTGFLKPVTAIWRRWWIFI